MKKNTEKKLNGTVIVTYRCNARCSMCNRYKAPSKPEEEISLDTIKKLPKMYFTNITGGEPFIRTDLKDIVRELYKKSDRIVISTNGFFTDRIVDLCKEFPNIGIRISIEGLEETNNEIRGLQNGYQRGYGTLKKLREMGMKDVGFGMTVQDKNAPDLVPLYKISNEMGMEFATASLHNSFYFVEAKNIIHDRPMVAKNFEKLVNELLRSNSPKKWFRAYFNHGLINYIYGQKRLLPCDMSFDTFFIDPYGDVMPCNGTKDKEVIGNNYLRGLFALAFQGFFMMVCVGIYAVLVANIQMSDNIHSALFGVMAYTVILCFSLMKTGNFARSIFNAH
jgi:MoaA/NifB/PqqE/SkfB family radical SAM enzyme